MMMKFPFKKLINNLSTTLFLIMTLIAIIALFMASYNQHKVIKVNGKIDYCNEILDRIISETVQ